MKGGLRVSVRRFHVHHVDCPNFCLMIRRTKRDKYPGPKDLIMPKKKVPFLRKFRVRVKSVGLNLLGVSVNFEVKKKRGSVTPRIRKDKTALALPAQSSPSQGNIVLDTLHEIADKERKKALRGRDWQTAFVAALVQGMVQQEQKKQQ